MRRIALVSAGLVAGLASGACRSGGIPLINLLGLDKPLVIALVAEPQPLGANPLPALNPFGPYEPLRQALSHDLQRPVALDLCLPLQLSGGLESGFYHLAILTAGQYVRLPQPERFQVAAISCEPDGHPGRCALLVARREDGIDSPEDLKGQIVAFGPSGDGRTHLAALKLLSEHGVLRQDLPQQILPIPGSLRHFPDDQSVLADVLAGGSVAGFVDEQAWSALPEQAPSPSQPDRTRLVVVARTARIPDRLVILSGRLDPETAQRAARFFTSLGTQHAEALQPLKEAAYCPPAESVVALCRQLAGEAAPPADSGATP